MNYFQKKKQLEVYSLTDTGKRRVNNEDSIASLVINFQSFNKKLNYGILVVADGIGGREIGEVASDIATRKFIKEVVNNTLIFSERNESINFSEILLKSVEVVNSEIWKLSEEKIKPIGTTLVGAVIVGNHIYIVNIGDSRAYLINPQKSITQITKDHTVVQEMLDAKIITQEQAKSHPKRNILTRALGLRQDARPDIFEEDIKNKILLLCSDGLCSMLDDGEIAKTINGNLCKSSLELISIANQHGGLDNISVALAHSS